MYREGDMSGDDKRNPLQDAAESKTLSMRGNSLRGNRETLESPSPNDGGGRFGKAVGHTPDMHVPRESDDPIVPEKRANNAGPKAAAEPVEGRGSAKGNATWTLLAPDTVPGRRGIGPSDVRGAIVANRYQPKARAV